MSARSTSTASRISAYARRHVRLTAAVAVAGVAAVVAAALAISGVGQGAAHATLAPTTNCSPVPSKCGFPDATNTGVPAGMTLKSVPAQVSSGPGWYSTSGGGVEVTGNGVVLSGLSISGNLDITGDNVTINDVKVTAAGNFGVSLRHTSGVVIENSTISGQNATDGRVGYAVTDIYGDSTGQVIKNNNIFFFRTGVQTSAGAVTGNYVHDPGYISGDHTNGIFVNGTAQPLTISGNTILNSLSQTDAINLDASNSSQLVANKTITDNLIAGGGYAIYGGAARSAVTSNIIIKGNIFSQLYYDKGGQYGPVGYFNSNGRGNVWAGNVWAGAAEPGSVLQGTIRGGARHHNTIPAPR